MQDDANYPDILGLITGGARCNLGAVHAALAVRPRVVPAGQPFEVLVLLQNATDAAVDVTASIILPDVDARKERGRFVAKSARLVVGMTAAEAGVIVLPATSLPDTAAGDYRVTVDLEAKPLSKARRIRQPNGGGAVLIDHLPEHGRQQIGTLRELQFSVQKRFGRSALDAPFTLHGVSLAPMIDFKAGWVSLCKLADYADPRPILHRYADTLRAYILPRLKRGETYAPLLTMTEKRFRDAGYPLQPAEAVLIAKLLTLILEYAAPKETAHGYIAAGGYGIQPLIDRDPLTLDAPPTLPRWCSSLLVLMERDPRVIQHPVSVVVNGLYNELLYDAVVHGFDLVAQATGEDLGTPDEVHGYAAGLVSALKVTDQIDFSRAYLPLVIAGVLISDKLPVSKESPAELLSMIAVALEKRRPEISDDIQPIYEIASELIDRTSLKYGFRTL